MKVLSFLILILLIPLTWAQKPNIILIITDDQGFGDCGFSGNNIIQTPCIDQLVEEGTLLNNFHVDPTCAPTRAALLTGRYSARTGVWHTVQGRNMLRSQEITLANILTDNGYKTGLFGKWHLGDNYPYRAEDRGFQHTVMHAAGGVGQSPDYWGNDYFDDTYLVNGRYQQFNGFCTDVWFDQAIEFITTNKDRPFFAYIAPNAPHSPFYCPTKYTKIYEGDQRVPNIPFYGMITNIDDNLGKLMEVLDQAEIKDNTILIYMTDNGTSAGLKGKTGFNAGMRGKKNSEYEGGHRVPLIIKWPNGNIKPGKSISQLTAHIDIVPTIIDLCNLRAPITNYDGKSLKDLLISDKPGWLERTLIVESQRVVDPIKWRKSAVMTERWRLINGKELYDIIKDPSQKKDLKDKYPKIVNHLRNSYENFWNDVSREHAITSHITIGSDNAPIVALSSHDWLIDQLSPWNQKHIIEGFCATSSFWSVQSETDGTYEVSLRRWPAETDKAINDGTYGKAYNYTHARLKINDIDVTKPIPLNAKEVTFSIELPKGIFQLAPEFISQDVIATPYYAYVTHKPKRGWQTPKGMGLPIYDPSFGSKPPQLDL